MEQGDECTSSFPEASKPHSMCHFWKETAHLLLLLLLPLLLL